VLLEKPPNRLIADVSSPQPLPKVLCGEDILIDRLGPVPASEQVLYKLLQNNPDRVLADSPTNSGAAKHIL
jgi:hypothetical protein